jgi:lysophospholipase L1-like esterase
MRQTGDSLGSNGLSVRKGFRRARWIWSCLVVVATCAVLGSGGGPGAPTALAAEDSQWAGTWAAAPQAAIPGGVQTFQNQTLRLIVHASVGGKKVRIKISNVFGDQPLVIGSAHIARRAAGPDIDPASDRSLTFSGHVSTTVAAGSLAVSDAADLDVPPLSDLAISLFFPNATAATTWHILALQTNYVSSGTGDSTAAVKFPVAKTIATWPFLTGVDVEGSRDAGAIVAFGSSTTDGDGSTEDANKRWPDILAARLQKAGGADAQLGVLNEGIIGNRLLSDAHSPGQAGGPFEATLKGYGDALGQAGLARFERDVLEQTGVRYVILNLGVNDILFPGAFIPATESVDAKSLIRGNQELIMQAHKKGIRVIGATIPPCENATFRNPTIHFYTEEKERVRQEVNRWIRSGGEFDGVIDFDVVVRDPKRPTQVLPAYDSGDHLHVNDAGNVAQGNAIRLELFQDQSAKGKLVPR